MSDLYLLILLIEPQANHPLFEWRVNSPLFTKRNKKRVAKGLHRDVARIFQRGVTLCQSEGTQDFHVVFVMCCRLFASKKGLQKGASRAPHGPPSYASDA